MINSGLMRRLGAIVYDSLLVLALLFVVTIPFIAIRGGQPVEAGDSLLYRLCLAVVIFVFFTGFWSHSGRTLGMQSWGLRVGWRNTDIHGGLHSFLCGDAFLATRWSRFHLATVGQGSVNLARPSQRNTTQVLPETHKKQVTSVFGQAQ